VSTRRFYLLGFGALLLFDTITQISFKLVTLHAGEFELQLSWVLDLFLNYWIYLAVLGYLGAFVTWMTLLKHAPIGPAFAASHLELLPVLIISVVVFDERLTFAQMLGVLCIVLGVVCLSLSKAENPDA
jgi:drug/metabolite transporter (DMT)-like permease